MTDAMGAVAAATAGVARLYKINEVPTSPTFPYASFSALLGEGDSYLLDASEGVRWGQVVVQAFGRTGTSAGAKLEEVRAALVGTSLDITGYDTTPCRAELRPVIVRDPDTAGVVGVTATYTFTATKEA